MATVILVKPKDVKRLTALGGSVDVDNFIQFIKMAQDMEIQNVLGTKLYDRLQLDVSGGTLSGDYETLLNDYVKDCLIHYAMAYYTPFAAYTISDGGVYKHRSENSDTASKDEVEALEARSLDKAQFYTRRLNDYLCWNSSLFPEYTQNQNGNMYPDSAAGDFNGIVI